MVVTEYSIPVGQPLNLSLSPLKARVIGCMLYPNDSVVAITLEVDTFNDRVREFFNRMKRLFGGGGHTA